MNKPNFLVIGAQKAGTTYLCASLLRHPEVFFSSPKELMFFQKADITESDFHSYLKAHFSDSKDQRWVGEGSTVYFQWPHALPNIRRFLGPELKVIICLRHPVEKAISYYLHNWRKKRLVGNEPILEFTDPDWLRSPLGSRMYADALERWLSAYGREQVHVMLFDTLRKSRLEFVRLATDFLSLRALGKVTEKVVNRGISLRWNGERLELKTDTVPAGQVAPVISAGEIGRLQDYFRADIERTEALLGMDLSAWKAPPAYRS